MIYQFTPLFDGTDEDEQQIVEVVKVLGTAGFLEWAASPGYDCASVLTTQFPNNSVFTTISKELPYIQVGNVPQRAQFRKIP
jgi:hypothetical protein